MIKKKLSRLAEAILETAEGQHRIGIMDDATFNRIKMRHLGEAAGSKAAGANRNTSLKKGSSRPDRSK